MAMINVDFSEKLPSVLSFCSGYAGIERGFELAGFEHRAIAYVEIESFAIANLVAKMEDNKLVPAPIWSNLKTFPAQIFRDKVDVLTAGYPCQPFSAAGRRQGEDDPRHLWPIIREHIATIRPVRCFFENVEGHISLGLRDVLEDLAGLGYSTTWGLFSASEVGAPHQRKRIFILAHSDGSRQLQSEGTEQDQWGRIGNGSEELAYTDSFRCENDRVSSGTSERDVEVEVQQRSSQSLVWGEIMRCGQVSNTVSPRSETRLSRSERSNEEGNSGITNDCGSESSGWEKTMHWAFEPNVGRVVDGCADRVDRIRLLGNGVVPQTTAKAWSVLNGRVLDSHK
jgi:DNA (cytosine-5)-methyltransferase 1|tara:strand:+ start:360 stop:1379 length:1020 start_codon:yes stop_codon:yes gene_type:complete